MKGTKPMLIALGGKLLSLLAREIAPVVMSMLVRDGVRKLLKKFKKEKPVT